MSLQPGRAAAPAWIELSKAHRVRAEAVTAVTVADDLVTVVLADPELSLTSREQGAIDAAKQLVADTSAWSPLGQGLHIRTARIGFIQILCRMQQQMQTCDQALVSSSDDALSNVVVSGSAANEMKTLAGQFLQIDDNGANVSRSYLRPSAIKAIVFEMDQGTDVSAEVRVSTRGRHVVRAAGALDRLRKLQQ